MSPDRTEIGELVHRYCDALCQRDRDAWVGTFAETGVWTIGRGAVVGHDALSAAFLKIMALFEHVIQLTHSGEVKLDGDTARGIACRSDTSPCDRCNIPCVDDTPLARTFASS